MKNIKTILSILLLVTIICFLGGSFIEVTFNISNWDQCTRTGVVGFSAFIGFFANFIYMANSEY
jgi:uncharacterized membrane protein